MSKTMSMSMSKSKSMSIVCKSVVCETARRIDRSICAAFMRGLYARSITTGLYVWS